MKKKCPSCHTEYDVPFWKKVQCTSKSCPDYYVNNMGINGVEGFVKNKIKKKKPIDKYIKGAKRYVNLLERTEPLEEDRSKGSISFNIDAKTEKFYEKENNTPHVNCWNQIIPKIEMAEGQKKQIEIELDDNEWMENVMTSSSCFYLTDKNHNLVQAGKVYLIQSQKTYSKFIRFELEAPMVPLDSTEDGFDLLVLIKEDISGWTIFRLEGFVIVKKLYHCRDYQELVDNDGNIQRFIDRPKWV